MFGFNYANQRMVQVYRPCKGNYNLTDIYESMSARDLISLMYFDSGSYMKTEGKESILFYNIYESKDIHDKALICLIYSYVARKIEEGAAYIETKLISRALRQLCESTPSKTQIDLKVASNLRTVLKDNGSFGRPNTHILPVYHYELSKVHAQNNLYALPLNIQDYISTAKILETYLIGLSVQVYIIAEDISRMYDTWCFGFNEYGYLQYILVPDPILKIEPTWRYIHVVVGQHDDFQPVRKVYSDLYERLSCFDRIEDSCIDRLERSIYPVIHNLIIQHLPSYWKFYYDDGSGYKRAMESSDYYYVALPKSVLNTSVYLLIPAYALWPLLTPIQVRLDYNLLDWQATMTITDYPYTSLYGLILVAKNRKLYPYIAEFELVDKDMFRWYRPFFGKTIVKTIDLPSC